jgi:hypothetical protein
MLNLQKTLNKYDKWLISKRGLDGLVEVYRKSPFTKRREHIIFKIENQYVGSGRWIRIRLIKSDSQRFNFAMDSMMHNRKIQTAKSDDRVTRDIASFFESGGSSINI